MERETIEVVRLERLTEMKPLQDAFKYSPGNGWAWAQRLAIKLLRWRRCFACTEYTTYERHVIGPKGRDFMAQLLDQKRNLFDFGQRPRELLIGSEDFAQLVRGEPSVTGFDFRTEYYVTAGFDQKPTICGLHVRVIPWMRGILVMP